MQQVKRYTDIFLFLYKLSLFILTFDWRVKESSFVLNLSQENRPDVMKIITNVKIKVAVSVDKQRTLIRIYQNLLDL